MMVVKKNSDQKTKVRSTLRPKKKPDIADIVERPEEKEQKEQKEKNEKIVKNVFIKKEKQQEHQVEMEHELDTLVINNEVVPKFLSNNFIKKWKNSIPEF